MSGHEFRMEENVPAKLFSTKAIIDLQHIKKIPSLLS